MIATSQFTISVVNDGQTGSQGVSVVRTYPQWRLSDSSTELTGSGTGYSWSTTKPSVPAGKYIWERTITELSDNTTTESTAVCDIVMSGVIFDVDANTQAITNKVWSSDISTAINTYDGSTAQLIRDNVSQLTTDLSGITTRVGAAETAITTKADGSTVTTLSNDYSAFKQTMSGFKTTVESDYAQLTDLDNLKVSGNNLYVIKDSVPGYLHASDGSIVAQSSTYEEYTSDYIPVVASSTYIIQSWATPTTTGGSWLAYQFFTDASAANAIGSRTDKQGSDTGSGVDTTAEGMEHLMYKVEAPSTANYLRVSFRAFSDGYCMVEQATMPSEYSVSYKDVNQDISSVRTVAEQTADQFSWIVADGSSSSSVTYTSNALTAMANQIDLTGKVTFNSMDSTLQNRVTTVETNANTALKGMKAYSGTCSTLAGDGTKVVSCSDTDFDLTNGTIITVTFSVESTADSPKLNVNSKGEKSIYFNGAITSFNNKFRWKAGSVITFQYDGTYWNVLNYQNIDYFTSSTTAATTTKTTDSVDGTFVLCKGSTVTVFFSASNSAGQTYLNVGSTGSFYIYYKNAQTLSSNKYSWDANTTISFTFDGSNWCVNDGGAQLVKDYAKSAVDWVSTNGAGVVTAKSILDSWKGEAVSGTTTINGGLIQTHTIESQHLATDAIMSSNYDSGTQNQETPTYNATTNPYHFSTDGTFLDLASGNIYSPNFSVINTVPTGSSVGVGAYISGHINATSGTIGGCSIVDGTLKIAEANIDGTLSANVINASTLSIGMSQVTDLSTTLNGKASTTSVTTLANKVDAVYGTCDTAESTQTKAVTCSNFTLFNGALITVRFSKANQKDGTIKLNVNSTGAKDIYVRGQVSGIGNPLLWGTDAYITFRYNGTGFVTVGEPRTWYGTCSTGATTVAKGTTIDRCVICKGSIVSLKMNSANSVDSPTLKVSSTVAYPIKCNDQTLTQGSYLNWTANSTISFVFDGNYWRYDSDASNKAAEAAKTATNYLYFDSTNGLVISQTGVVGTGYNTQITNSGMNIRNGTTTLASYGSTITLGEIADGVTRVEIDNDSLDIISRDNNSVDTTFATFGINGIVLGNNNDTHIVLDENSLEIYAGVNNTEIAHIGSYDAVEVVEALDGDGVTTQFTLQNEIAYVDRILKSVLDEDRSDQEHQIYVTVYLVEGEDFTFSGDTITFTEPIPSYASDAHAGRYVVGYYRPFNAPIYTFGSRQVNQFIPSGGVGEYSTVLGVNCMATARCAVAEGGRTEASGEYSHSEGEDTEALSKHCHAEGYNTKAYGDDSRGNNIAAHAEGNGCEAYGVGAHAEGYGTIARGDYSHAQNLNTIAKYAQTVIGTYNVEDTTVYDYESNYAFIIGNGTYGSPSNALTVDWNGNLSASGALATGNKPQTRKNIGVICGSVNDCSVQAGKYADYPVSFGSYSFSSTPYVVVGFVTNSDAGAFGKCCCTALLSSISTTGFTIRVFNGDTSGRSPRCHWIAIGN